MPLALFGANGRGALLEDAAIVLLSRKLQMRREETLVGPEDQIQNSHPLRVKHSLCCETYRSIASILLGTLET